MFQCTACGLLSVRDTSCPGCGGMSFLDLEAEDATSLEGFGEVPGLDEAASALHEIAPPPEEKPVVDDEPEGDLPFGFGGMARAHSPSLPFGFGASSLGLASLRSDGSDEGPYVHDAVEEPTAVALPPTSEPTPAEVEATVASPPLPIAQDEPPHAELIEATSEAVVSASSDTSLPDVPDLWSGSVVDVRGAYGLEQVQPPVSTLEPTPTPEPPAWPPFAVVGPESALLDGLLREPTVEAFRALASEDWSLAQERFELLLATGVDGVSLRTAAGIACMEIGADVTAGLQHLKQAAKLSGGNLSTLHNLAVAMAMDGRVDGVERLLATVANVPDEGGFVGRMHEARKLMDSSSA